MDIPEEVRQAIEELLGGEVAEKIKATSLDEIAMKISTYLISSWGWSPTFTVRVGCCEKHPDGIDMEFCVCPECMCMVMVERRDQHIPGCVNANKDDEDMRALVGQVILAEYLETQATPSESEDSD